MLVIDRVEDGFAVIIGDNGERRTIEAALLYCGAKEGDVVDESNGLYVFNKEETQKRKNAIAGKYRDLFRRRNADTNNGKDLENEQG